ncbi:MAG TPA: hypothetical protein VMF06_21580 [Candidatus Limnocylindria bacterium]|jgi:hypothetical protein|nr:hypothetical protein [Candidatus Limnocylindria bacterium]
MISSDNSERLWGKAVEVFRSACLYRRSGQADEATRLLEKDVPFAIAAWSQASSLAPAERRFELERMFREEQRRVDDAWFLQRVVTERFERTIIPALRDSLAEEVRETVIEAIEAVSAGRGVPTQRVGSEGQRRHRVERKPNRIRFDDIPAVIDSILREQTADQGMKPVLEVA